MSSDPMMDVAIVGMSGRFPGASDIHEFWQLVRAGRDGTRRLSDAELAAAGVPDFERADARYVPVWSGIEGADLFDAGFFGYSPQDAALIDPQHRVFLECAWEALEDAGYDARQFSGDIAVYAGCGINQYLLYHLLPHRDLVDAVGRISLALASDKDNLATRTSYKLDLTGPSLTVQANCSSAMVALHHAVNSLLDYECDAAIVGAVSIKNPVPRGYRHEADGISSPDGQCRAFDAGANGYFLGDGAGAVVLRRREDAVADGASIYALIKGSAVNNDGAAKVSFTAPGRRGQVRVIGSALRVAGIDPATIQYIEANGSGTLMGDAIEVSALAEVYSARARSAATWAIGSVKSNIGNLDTAAGMAALIKTVMAIRHGELPPSIHYQCPNPQTRLADGPVRVNDVLRPWPVTGSPRRGAVSSFGVGGTNAHVILEQPPPTAPSSPATPAVLLTVSATGKESLTAACLRLAEHLRQDTGEALDDVAYTTHVGRRAFAHRAFAVAGSRQEAAAVMASVEGAEVAESLPIMFAFSADCPHAPMLGAHVPLFRAELDRVGSVIRAVLGIDPSDVRAAPSVVAFATQYALAGVLAGWGLSPIAAYGDGAGGLVAAVLSGAISEREAICALGGDWAAASRASAPPAAGQMTGTGRPTGHQDAVLVSFGAGTAAGPGDEIITLLNAGHDYRALLTAVGALWQRGASIDWGAFHAGQRRRRVRLPSYPFQRVSHWIEPAEYAPQPRTGWAPDGPACDADTAVPGTPIQNAVADVWRRRLGVAQPGAHDPLLRLGGDSLTAAQILTDLAGAFHVELDLREFLEAPTIAAVAEMIESRLLEAEAIRATLASVTGAEDG